MAHAKPIALFAFGLALMTAYYPWIMGAGTAPRWTVLALGLLALVFCGPVRVTMAHIIGAAFVGLAIASLAWSPAWHDGIGALLQLLILAGVFVLGSQISDLRPFYVGAAVGIGVSGILALTDILGFKIAPGLVGGGLFVNPLFMAEAAVLVAAALLGLSQLKSCRYLSVLLLPAIAVPLAVGTGRGPLLALLACALVVIWPHARAAAATLATMFMIGLAAAISARPASVADRLGIWQDTISGLTMTGWGFGSFFGEFPRYAEHLLPTINRNDHVHNMMLEIAFELGPLGVGLALWFFWLLLRHGAGHGPRTAHPSGGGQPVERSAGGVPAPTNLVLIAFLTEGLFAFPDRLPATAGFALLCAGHASRSLPRWRDAMGIGRTGLRSRYGCYDRAGFH